MAYDLPGVTLTEQRGAPTPLIPESQRNHVIVGKIAPYIRVSNESVTRSSTGYADSLGYTSTGIYSVIEVSSVIGLGDYIEGRDFNLVDDEIVWTSTGLIPSDGATYYVTYNKDRLDSEYGFFRARNIEELYAQAGYPLDDIQNVAIYGQIAFNIYAIPVLYVQPVKPPYTNTNFLSAIQLLKNRDVQSVSVLNTDSTVRATAAKHVKERSLAVSKRERMLWTGAPTGTDAEDMATLASAIDTEEVVFVSPTRANVTWFDITNNVEVTSTVDGAGLGCLVGLYRDSFSDPSYSLLRKRIPGFELFENDYEEYFTEDNLKILGAAGCLQIMPYKDQFDIPMAVDEITTEPTNFKTSSIAVVTAKHYNTKAIREAVDDAFTGKKIYNPVAYAQGVRNFVVGLMAKLVNKGSIAYFEEGDVQAKVGESFDGKVTNPSKVWLSYFYYAVYIHKYTEGQYTLLP